MKLQMMIVLALSLCVTSRNNEDEGRPYEFGFTIDGQQHRRESKDVNGIIMGEFGFITADGIYHVTVYATDENGSFKILSMRNVRVSGPLDEPGYQFPKKSPGASEKLQVSSSAPPISISTTIATTTPNYKAPYVFTTIPSLKVASCGSCKLPSTTPKAPGVSNKLPFQTPQFQDNKSGPGRFPPPNGAQNPPIGGQIPPFGGQTPTFEGQTPTFGGQNPPFGRQNPPIGGQNPPFGEQTPTFEGQTPTFGGQNTPFGGQNPPLGVQNPPLGGQNLPQPPIGVPNIPPIVPKDVELINPVSSQLDKFGLGNLDPRFEPEPVKPSEEQQPPFPINPDVNLINPSIAPTPTHEKIQLPPLQNQIPDQTPNPTHISPPPNNFNPLSISVSPPPNPNRPEISISGNQINIPGKDPIQIKDRYPGMVDGLPDGITEKDMLDLLYKFNYTLGFHGHHERGLKNGAKIGAYFVNGRDGIMRVVEYIADENGYRPKVKFINLGLDSPDTPKEGTEKTFGLKGFEFVWYPV